MFHTLTKLLCAMVLVNPVLAQSIFISLPKEGTTVIAGSNITVRLNKPMTLTGSTEVAVVIGARPCKPVCLPATEVLGEILHVGPYDPRLNNDSEYPYQNFTITVSDSYRGLVQLGVARFYLLGAGQVAQMEVLSTTIHAVLHEDSDGLFIPAPTDVQITL